MMTWASSGMMALCGLRPGIFGELRRVIFEFSSSHACHVARRKLSSIPPSTKFAPGFQTCLSKMNRAAIIACFVFAWQVCQHFETISTSREREREAYHDFHIPVRSMITSCKSLVTFRSKFEHLASARHFEWEPSCFQWAFYQPFEAVYVPSLSSVLHQRISTGNEWQRLTIL